MRYIFIPISAIILFFPAGWLFSKVVGNDWGTGIAAFIMYIWYPYMAFNFLDRKKFKMSDIPDMAQALALGELEVSSYSVRSIVEIEEWDDEGMFFLLEVGENKTLCLRGQYLYESTENGSFPSPEIKVFWNKRLGFTYGVEGNGDKLEPAQVLPPLSNNQWDFELMPEDRELIHKDISEVVKAIEGNA